jgi:Undecaprenyl-phosphate galactose phosphotransferase WbaP
LQQNDKTFNGSNPNWIRLSKLMLVVSDVVAMLLSAGLAMLLAPWLGNEPGEWLQTQDIERFYAWVGIGLVGLAMFLVRFRHYSDRKPFWTELNEVLRVILLMALLDLALVAFAKWNASRLWWLLIWLLAAMAVPLMRYSVRKLLTAWGLWLRPTVLVGYGPNAHEALAALHSEPEMGFKVVGFVDVAPAGKALADVQGVPLLTLDEVKAWGQVPGVQVVVALEHGQNAIREKWLRCLARWKVEDISVIPAMRGVPLYGTDISYFFSHEVAMLKLRNNLRYWPARLLKRVFDLLAALALLAVGWPLLLYLSWRIRQDGGPAIFAHKRVGQSGKVFACYKFRSMRVDAEEQLRELLASDPALRVEWEKEFKLKDDPRISEIGHFLRRTSLDELPQLFNVIKGEMSLVGPRPVVRIELERYGDDVDYFLMVRPGMTGLWQVSGRNDVNYDTRVYLDTWYVKNWSLWYDIAILFKTIRVVLKRDGAY